MHLQFDSDSAEIVALMSSLMEVRSEDPSRYEAEAQHLVDHFQHSLLSQGQARASAPTWLTASFSSTLSRDCCFTVPGRNTGSGCP